MHSALRRINATTPRHIRLCGQSNAYCAIWLLSADPDQVEPKRPNMLSVTFVKSVKTPDRSGDGRGGLGLSLLVRTAVRGHVTTCWTQSVRIDRRPTSIGLGRYPVVTLALVRQQALENAGAIAEGRDPRRRAASTVPTFAEACETVTAIHAGSWKPGGRNEENCARRCATTYSPGSPTCPSTPSPARTSWPCCCRSGPRSRRPPDA